MWLKFRGKYSSGHSENWEWHDFGDVEVSEEDVKEYLNEYSWRCGIDTDWTGHWRGWEKELVESPPKEMLESRRDDVRRTIEGYVLQLVRLNRQIDDL